MSEIKIQTNQCPQIKVQIFETEIDALLDSGASISVTNSTDLIDRYGLKILPSPIRICTADQTQYSCEGYANFPMTFRNVTKVVPVVVVPQVSRTFILGINFWNAFGIKPMMEGKEGLEDITEITQAQTAGETINELVHFFIHPVEVLPEIEKPPPDDSLDIPGLDLPEPSATTPETVETEHDLTSEERNRLTEVVRTFPCTTDGVLGRTTLLQHEINLREDDNHSTVAHRQFRQRWRRRFNGTKI